MNKAKWLLTSISILFFYSSVFALEVYEPGYTVEIYAVYPQSVGARGMAWDFSGNLYVTHYPPAAVWRITPDGAAKSFAAVEDPRGIVWAGLTMFGDYLYAVHSEGFRGDIIRVAPDGTTAHFASLSGDGPTPLALDSTGSYGGLLYVATRGDDRIYRIDTQGRESTFSSFPYSRNGGGPISLAFDITGNYGGLMYIANTYTPGNEDVSGLFSIDTKGNATRFTKDLAQAGCIAFAPDFALNEYMYVTGKSKNETPTKLWRIDPGGHAAVFASDCNQIAFGTDGSLYTTEFSKTHNMVTISRISKKDQDINETDGNNLYIDASFRKSFAVIRHGIVFSNCQDILSSDKLDLERNITELEAVYGHISLEKVLSNKIIFGK